MAALATGLINGSLLAGSAGMPLRGGKLLRLARGAQERAATDPGGPECCLADNACGKAAWRCWCCPAVLVLVLSGEPGPDTAAATAAAAESALGLPERDNKLLLCANGVGNTAAGLVVLSSHAKLSYPLHT